MAENLMRWMPVMIGLGGLAGACGPNPVSPPPPPMPDGGQVESACPELAAGLASAQCAALRQLRLPASPPPSRGNKYADDVAAATFGHYNFFDTSLSKDGRFSCATCHKTEAAFQDGLSVSKATGTGTRNAPTTLLAAQVTTWFWDGRADALWSVPLFAIENPLELDQTRLQLVHHVADDPHMRAQYEAAFGPLPDLSDAKRFPAKGKPGDPSWDGMAAADQVIVDRVFVNVGKSLEAYMRKATTGPAPLDRYLDGDQGAISAAAKRGLTIYAKACVDCHSGPALTDLTFQDLAVAGLPGAAPDPGRSGAIAILNSNPLGVHGQFADPVNIPGFGLPEDPAAEVHEFRVPSLRDAVLTGPYGHDGAIADLRDMINHVVTFDNDPAGADDMMALMGALTGAPPPAPWNADPGARP
jgi:cytochrome c peroxidase